MVEVASYITPNFAHQITYRDKAAPPTSWEQFVLDPLVMQQFYETIQKPFGEETLNIASNIRSFLDLPQPLPPSRQDPHPDPIRFQRLDHTFTRHQWLFSVCSCRSKLHTGFPTDHYALVTEIQIKLSSRTKRSPGHRKLDDRYAPAGLVAGVDAQAVPPQDGVVLPTRRFLERSQGSSDHLTRPHRFYRG